MSEENTPPSDDVSQKALDDLENGGKSGAETEAPILSEREQLEVRATLLGVKFQTNTGDAKLRLRVEEAEKATTGTEKEAGKGEGKASTEAKPNPFEETDTKTGTEDDTDLLEPFTIVNTSKNRRSIKGVELAVGESYTLTEADMGNERLMMKINHALDLGVLSRD